MHLLPHLTLLKEVNTREKATNLREEEEEEEETELLQRQREEFRI